jgi:hypothetical protein
MRLMAMTFFAARSFLVGLTVGLRLLAYEAWPSRRSIDKLKARLERDGAMSYLDEELQGQRLE